jgi:hypothetical protein
MEIDMTDTRLPRFKIAANIFDALSLTDIKLTALDMGELGLCVPPFDKYCIHIKVSFIDKIYAQVFDSEYKSNLSSKAELIFVYDFLDHTYTSYYARDGRKFLNFNPKLERDFAHVAKYFDWASGMCEQILIVLLATKNIQKDVETCNKPNSRHRREQTLSKYSSTTTISIGKISKTMRSADGTGGPVRPHLRRGHIRNQPHGPGNSEVRRIFIQPMFINADQGWIDTKKEYRVTA